MTFKKMLDAFSDETGLDPDELLKHVESMPVETLILLVSERTTHFQVDWADGTCRVEIGQRETRFGVGRAVNFRLALARAMWDWDEHELGSNAPRRWLHPGGAS